MFGKLMMYTNVMYHTYTSESVKQAFKQYWRRLDDITVIRNREIADIKEQAANEIRRVKKEALAQYHQANEELNHTIKSVKQQVKAELSAKKAVEKATALVCNN